MRNKTIALALLLLLACAEPQVSRDAWQRMSSDEKTIYVGSLIGAEKVKDAKGGGGRKYDETPDEYAKRIDAAYARGDARDPDAIFAEMGTR